MIDFYISIVDLHNSIYKTDNSIYKDPLFDLWISMRRSINATDL